MGKVPKHAVSFLYEESALVYRATNLEDAPNDAPVATLNSNFTTGQADTDLCWSEPMFFPSATTDTEGSRLQRMPEAAMGENFTLTVTACLDGLEKEGKSGSRKRLRVLGGKYDRLEDTAFWVPDSWRNGHLTPEALRGHGCPWVMASYAGDWRCGHESWPTTGHGQLLHCHTGSATVICWPASAVLTRGATLAEMDTWLFKDLTVKEFGKWAKQCARYQTMHTGTTCWIPFG